MKNKNKNIVYTYSSWAENLKNQTHYQIIFNQNSIIQKIQ